MLQTTDAPFFCFPKKKNKHNCPNIPHFDECVCVYVFLYNFDTQIKKNKAKKKFFFF